MKVIVRSGFQDIKNFAAMIPSRAGKFRAAPKTPLPQTYAVNETAKLLHPKTQQLVIKEVVQENSSTNSYILAPAGDTPLAPFRAGQYLSIQLAIGEAIVTRPYSISSSPGQAAQGEYRITVKRAAEGFVSQYILDTFTQGMTVEAFAPEGTFYYEPLRDAETVIGLAGGSGITPFLSMAKAIADGKESFRLILLYGCKTAADLLFRQELDALAQHEMIDVVYVLNDERAKGYEHGFICTEIIEKYAPKEYSVFVCGPQAMYDFVEKELETLPQLQKKHIRYELFGEPANPAGLKGYPYKAIGRTFTCTVHNKDSEPAVIPCSSEESLLVAMERAGIEVPSRCRSGACGFCRSKLLSGEVFVPEDFDGRRMADIKFGYIHPCSTYPLDDVALKIN